MSRFYMLGKLAEEKQQLKKNRPQRPHDMVNRIRAMAVLQNPPTQRAMSLRAGIPPSMTNRIIRDELKLKKEHKSRVHALTARHIAEWRTNARKLYKRHLSGTKWKFVVTLDEA
jgi:hypothetical protein